MSRRPKGPELPEGPELPKGPELTDGPELPVGPSTALGPLGPGGLFFGYLLLDRNKKTCSSSQYLCLNWAFRVQLVFMSNF